MLWGKSKCFSFSLGCRQQKWMTVLVLFSSRQDEDPLFAAEIPSLLFLQKNLLRELWLRFPSRFPGRRVSWASTPLPYKMDLFIKWFEERAVPASSPWAASRGTFWLGAETCRQTLPWANPAPQSLFSWSHYTHRINSQWEEKSSPGAPSEGIILPQGTRKVKSGKATCL